MQILDACEDTGAAEMTADSRNGAHTPGPWIEHGVLTTGSMRGCIAIGPTKVGRAIVVVHRRDVPLVKAAPDMLAALKRVLAVADRKTEEFDAARAVIARAEGCA
jgi:hypothetical protein